MGIVGRGGAARLWFNLDGQLLSLNISRPGCENVYGAVAPDWCFPELDVRAFQIFDSSS